MDAVLNGLKKWGGEWWQMLPSHMLTRGEVQLVRDHFCGSNEIL
jgi:hypothetical protein